MLILTDSEIKNIIQPLLTLRESLAEDMDRGETMVFAYPIYETLDEVIDYMNTVKCI